jgi:aminoglycoside phosphotransferase (APT) family kinase protein
MLPDRVTLDRLLHSALGAHCHVDGYTVVREDDDYAVLVVNLAAPTVRVIVKLAGPRAALSCPFDRTAAINRLVRGRTTVPTPEVLAADVSYRDWPWRYLVTTYTEGVTWEAGLASDATERGELYQQFGRLVAQLHTVRFPGYGEIDAGGRVVGDAPVIDALIERARRRIADRRHADLFASLLRERVYLFDDAPEPALCHEDLNPSNILVRHDGGRPCLAAILDFDSAWAGAPESDLARLDLWQSGAYPGLMEEGFRAAYMATHSVARGYEGRRPLYQLLWCLEYADASAQHAADTARVCAELGIAPVTFG